MKTIKEVIEFYCIHKDLFVNSDPETYQEALQLGKISTIEILYPEIDWQTEYKQWKEAKRC